MTVELEQTDAVLRQRPAERRAIGRVDVLGAEVSGVHMDQALDEICHWIAHGATHYVCVTGAHGALECSKDPELARIHRESGLTVPDGMPLVWFGRHVGLATMCRVRGYDLLPGMLERAAQASWSSYFYGAADGVPEVLAQRMTQRFPGLRVAGTYSPPFRPPTAEEDDAIVARINASGADIVWVGLSTPKQERWMAAHRDRLTAPVLIGVGAAFDFHAGLVREAPKWMQDAGLEWAFRLAIEPRRLWRRYLLGHSTFVWRVLRRRPRLVVPAETALAPALGDAR